MRKALKIGGITLSAMLIFLASYLALLLYPGVLFANKIKHGAFTVYSQDELPNEVIAVLEGIEKAIAASDVYDPNIEHDIILGHDNAAFKAVQWGAWQISSRFIESGPALTYNRASPPSFSQAITFRIPAFATNELLHPEHFQAINMTQVLTHEVVHTLLSARLGVDSVVRYPAWKIEGYADYVASRAILEDPSYDLRESVARILSWEWLWKGDEQGNYTPYGCRGGPSIKNEEGYPTTACYYMGRVLMEFAFDVKGMTFEEVMNSQITDTSMLKQLVAAFTTEILE